MSDLIERLRVGDRASHLLIGEAADELERFTNLLEYANNEIKDGRKETARLAADFKTCEKQLDESRADLYKSFERIEALNKEQT